MHLLRLRFTPKEMYVHGAMIIIPKLAIDEKLFVLRLNHKKMKKYTRMMLIIVSIAATTFIFSGCTKDGAAGPAGTAGANGSTGPTGSAGTNGTNGTNGKGGGAKAFNFLVGANSWTASSGGTTVTGARQWYHQCTVDSIPTGSAVMVYWNNFSSYYGLPFTNIDVEYGFEYSGNTLLTLTIQSASGKTVLSAPTSALNFEVVVVAPGMKTHNTNVNYKNYSEVKKAFNLPD